jgi:hydrogenase maturation factor
MIVLSAQSGGLALCADAEGRTHNVETALLEAAPVGGRVLVHADVAIAPLPAEAGQ